MKQITYLMVTVRMIARDSIYTTVIAKVTHEHLWTEHQLVKSVIKSAIKVRMIARDSMDSDCRCDPAALMDSTSIERNQLISTLG